MWPPPQATHDMYAACCASVNGDSAPVVLFQSTMSLAASRAGVSVGGLVDRPGP